MTSTGSAIKAALLWDAPALLRSDVAGAQEFYRAMNLRRGVADVRELPATQPLLVAARGLAAETEGDTDLAYEAYDLLLRSRSALARILGGCLSCWSPRGQLGHLVDLVPKVLAVRDLRLRAGVLTKLLAIAWEQGHHDLVGELYRHAETESQPFARLHTQLAVFGANELGLPLSRPLPNSLGRDLLVDQPWLLGLISDVLTRGVGREFRETVARSRRTIFGRSELADYVALDMQTTWAGQVWRLRERRLLVGEHVATRDNYEPDNYLYGLNCYLSGRGEDVEEYVSRVEPHLSNLGTELDLASLIDRALPPRFWFMRGRVSALAAVWDLLSDEAVVNALESLPLEEEPAASLATLRVPELLARLGQRAPRVWLERLLSLDQPKRDSLINQAPPTWAMQGQGRTLDSIRELVVRTAERLEKPAPMLLWLAARSTGQITMRGLELPPEVVAELAQDPPPWLKTQHLQMAHQTAMASAEQKVRDALEGTLRVGGSDPYLQVAALSGRMSEGTRNRTVDFLINTATDARLFTDLRLSAIRALFDLQLSSAVRSSFLVRLREARPPEPGAGTAFGHPAAELFLAYRDATLALADTDAAPLLPHSKASDRDVRALSTRTATVLIKKRLDDHSARYIIFASLFDTDMTVVRWALEGLVPLLEVGSGLRPGVEGRLAELLERGPRQVRARVVQLARVLEERISPSLQERCSTAAQEDASWLVRHAGSAWART